MSGISRPGDGLTRVPASTLSLVLAAGPPRLPSEGSDALDHLLRTAPLQTLSRYRIEGRLGAGGMGVVLTAYDPDLDRRVAIKLCARPDCPRARRRLVDEARTVARLHHPNVVEVFDIGVFEVDGPDRLRPEPGVFVVMEQLSGPSLREWVGRPIPLARVLDAFVDAARGLARAHAEGIVHRDVKPSNLVLAADGGARVVDFGLAQGAAPAAHLRPRHAGSILPAQSSEQRGVAGTPAFMAPEQHSTAAIDHRVDQFGLCASLVHVATGLLPFVPHGGPELLRDKLRGELRPEAMRRLPGRVRAIVRRGLAPDPEDRYPDMRALLDALDRARPRVASGRGRLVWLAGVLALLLAPRTPSAERVAACEGWRPLEPMVASLPVTGANASVMVAARRDLRARVEEWARWRGRLCSGPPVLSASEQQCLDERHARLLDLGQRLATTNAPRRSVLLPQPELGPLSRCVDGATSTSAPHHRGLAGRHDEVVALRDAGRFDRAAEAAEQLERRAGSSASARTRALLALERGRTELARGHHARALAYLSRGYFEAAHAEDHVLAVMLATDLVRATAEGDERQEPFVWVRHAYSHLDLLGAEGEAFAGTLEHNLGTLLLLRGDLEGAIEHLERGVWAQRRWTGADSLPTATAPNDLGGAYFHLGLHADAERWFQRALAIKRRHLGDEHPRLATTLDNLGALHSSRGRPDLALRYNHGALEIREAALGPDHLAVAASLENRSSSLVSLGHFSAASHDARRALSIRARHFGPDDPRLARSQATLGRALLLQGRTEAAIVQLRRALRGLERSASVDAALLASVEELLGCARAGAPDLTDPDHRPAGALERSAGTSSVP